MVFIRAHKAQDTKQFQDKSGKARAWKNSEVKAHVRHTGNERADEEARKASQCTDYYTGALQPRAHLKHLSWDYIYKYWTQI